jgi:hypothetical protein
LVINLLLYRKKIMQTMVMFPCKFSGMCWRSKREYCQRSSNY